MNVYHTALVIIITFSLSVMSILVYENDRLSRTVKMRFWEIYIVIILACWAEWMSIALNGAPVQTKILHILVKSADYILSPSVAVFFVRQIYPGSRTEKAMWIVMAVNAILSLSSGLTGGLFYVDADNYYHHGPAYFCYVIFYIIVFGLLIFSFYSYGKSFRRQNRISLTLILLGVLMGIGVQEVLSSELRVLYLILTLAAIMLYIHYTEFAQLKKDDILQIQQKMLETDTLTRLLSRYSYSVALNEYSSMPKLPEDLVTFSIDINGLKRVNDNQGHEAGDDLIIGASYCISTVLSPYGRCFRTGGDEFVAILRVPSGQIDAVCRQLREETDQWRGHLVDHLSLSIGTASVRQNPNEKIEGLIRLSDEQMYKDKSDYYKRTGLERRAH